MLKTKKDYMVFGKSLIDLIHNNFPESKVFKDVQIIPGWTIFFLVEIENNIMNCQFREWGGSPFYLVVESKRRKLAQLDLTNVLEENGKYTWYLSVPTNEESDKIFSSLYDFVEEIPEDYRKKVRETKLNLNYNPRIKKSGYLLANKVTREELMDEILKLIQNLYEYSKNSSSWKSRKRIVKIFNLEDAEAEEGYKEDKVYLYTQRNRDIVLKRKEMDDYTCKICGFRFELEGRKVIECHHLNPLSDGDVRITNINDLISVCPTCHRIIHLRKPPFTPDEVKNLLNKGGQK